MSDDDVVEEMVRKQIAQALECDGWKDFCKRYPEDCSCLISSKAALAAVAPLIAAKERERCAVVADAFPARTHGALATAPYAAAEQAADEIAAAIRALGDAT